MYKYSPLIRTLKHAYRKLHPVPTSPWTAGEVEDICAINLTPPQKLIDFYRSSMETLRRIKGDDVGDYLEFGVFNGNSIASLYKAREQTGMHSMRLFGFDGFKGLPPGSENEDRGVWKIGFYTCSFEQMQECLRRRDVDPDKITWVKGWYEETLSDDLAKKHSLNNIGIVMVDCDTYKSSKTVLNFLAPLITKPAIVCFDDWKLNNLDIVGEGEYRAFNEFAAENPQLKFKEIKSYNRKSKAFIVQP